MTFISLLRKKGVKFYTPENTKSPILSFYQDKENEFGAKMREKKIFVTARRWKKGHIRISPHFYNNEDDIDAFIDSFLINHIKIFRNYLKNI